MFKQTVVVLSAFITLAPVLATARDANAIVDQGGSNNLEFKAGGTGSTFRSVSSKLADHINVKDYGAKGDGTTDDSAAIQHAINDNPGSTIEFPYTGNSYLINTDINQSAPPVSFVIDGGTTFIGNGRLPAALTNSYQLNVGNYMIKTPSGGKFKYGNTTLQVESLPHSDFIGNAVPFYSGSASPKGNPHFTGFIWGGNSVATMNPSTGAYSGIGWEFDLNNFYKNNAGDGILVTGVGNFKPNIGVAVKRGNSTSDWDKGIQIQNYASAGLLIDGSTSQNPHDAIRLQGQKSNMIRMQPSDDTSPTSCLLYATDATGKSILYCQTKRGGIKIGPEGSEISFWGSNPAMVPPQNIPADSTIDVKVSFRQAIAGQTIVVTPSGIAPPTGIMWAAYCGSNGIITIRLANVTGTPINVPSGTWRVEVINH